jgi:Holliday junction resolvase RusA-like endonuclease
MTGALPAVTLDIPVPPSVNRTRRIDWSAHTKVRAWKRETGLGWIASGQLRPAKHWAAQNYDGRFELLVIVDEKKCRLDPDNLLKCAIDLLREHKLITDDSFKYVRRLTVEPGYAPAGARIVLREAA